MNISRTKPIFILTLLSGLSTGFAVAAFAVAAGNGHSVVTPDGIEWQEGPDFIEPGAELALLAGDPAEGAFTARVRLPAGYDIHSHYHTGNKYLTVVSGALYIGFGDELDKDQGMQVPAGSFVKIPPQHNHYEWFEEETVLQIHVAEPFEVIYVDPDLDPRNQ